MKNKKKMKEAFEGLLQYGWMWGHPRHITAENWIILQEFYKEELNNGKEFRPDEYNKAIAV
jgi:hypothetical protein